ncbi:MAG: GtrA family protein [Vicinamibacterales bacterium]
MSSRLRAFLIVGALGFMVQLAVLSVLIDGGIPLVVSTALAVEAAVLHNFVWHERWTWRDRRGIESRVRRLVRFHSSTALISIAGNVALTWLFVSLLHLPPIAANALAVVAASGANFLAADRWVFVRRTAMDVVAVLAVLAVTPAFAGPSTATLDAWVKHVAAADAASPPHQTPCPPSGEPVGEATRVAGGIIHRWRACTRVKGTTVPALVQALIESGTPPPQPDVIESRLLSRHGDRLHVFLRLERKAVVTVSYDTEHEVTFRHASNVLATSRSVSTRIRQSDGGDRGFLWRLNSYWVYRQVGPDVEISLTSLSLSRDIPGLLRPVVLPVAARVARESMLRTLCAVRQFVEP